MVVFTLLGSPRRHGNTAQVLAWVEDELRSNGHTVDRANIIEYRIGPCRESHRCRYPQVNACGTEDDAAALFERMLKADKIIVASPVFCWGFPAPLKAFIDRLYCLAGFHEGIESAIQLDGKPLALVSTCGGPRENNADIMFGMFRNLVGFWNAEDAGELLFAEADAPGALGDEAEQESREFARGLAGM